MPKSAVYFFFNIFVSIFLSLSVLAQELSEQFEPYWEYGLGLGSVHYEIYPAANQFSNFTMIFPTFQYRGKILRANDRDGARAYLFTGENWDIQISGTFYPAYDSSKDEIRRGMENLPWVAALGPQFVYSFTDNFKISFGVFQAIIANLPFVKGTGEIFEGRVTYRTSWDHTFGRLDFKIRGGTQELLSTYYQVNPSEANPSRLAYNAQDGLLSQQLSYYQTYKTGRMAFYLGGSFENYAQSANRNSPLHKSDLNFTYAAGITYILGESKKPAVHEHDTSGVINKLKTSD